MPYTLSFPTGDVKYLLHSSFIELDKLVNPKNCIILTDETIYSEHQYMLEAYKTITIPAGELQKSWETIQYIIDQLIHYEAHRKSYLIGLGGGVITDITGFAASIYMRGIAFGFIPTTLLGMVDAAIGGKNGINSGLQKNLVGTINQPKFVLYDTKFLKTLPVTEWSNGFAEVIKYACLYDARLFKQLSDNDINYYQQDENALTELIETCVDWKNKVVLADEKETGQRKLLNFGHTAGHAFEKLYNLPHGYAVGLGMIAACMISEKEAGLDSVVRTKLRHLLKKYDLPTELDFDTKKVMGVLLMDKKRNTDSVDYILLEDIGKAIIKPLSFETIENTLATFSYAGDHQTR